jgi:type II secretory pathway pseudopilin PulG
VSEMNGTMRAGSVPATGRRGAGRALAISRAAGGCRGNSGWRPPLTAGAFSLIEMLAVIVIVLTLIGLMTSVVAYVQRRMAIAVTESQIAAIGTALESYKSDHGYYPLTTPLRISAIGSVELSNNAILYRALFGQGKPYLKLPAKQVRTDVMSTHVNNTNLYLYDVFNTPFNYYCSPATPFSLTGNVTGVSPYVYTNPCTRGGQVNTSSYDLFSYGPDRLTYVGTNVFWPSLSSQNITKPEFAVDDVTNWRR